ncbi:hypothetical protein [Puniceibacterium confluentis]|nr:hypothetical protein [Puniceibacterium confluentis]
MKGGTFNMIKLQCQNSFAANQGIMRRRREAPRKARSTLISEEMLQSILVMFLDLGLDPLEISRTSGLPLEMILEGLVKLKFTIDDA